MTPFLQLVLVLIVALAASKTASLLAVRLGQPSVLGELLIGIILGPSLLNLTHLPIFAGSHVHETIIELGELGVLLLMFLAGLELELDDLAKNLRISAYAGVLGVVLPVLLGWGAGALFGLSTPEALFLGLILGATSVSISAQTLMELKVLRTRVGLGLLGAAVIDDVLVILLLSIVVAVFSASGGILSILWIVLRIAGFLALSAAFGMWALPWLSRRAARLEISQPSLSFALVILLLYGLASEVLGGMAAITGTFVAGLMFGRTPEKERIERGMGALAYALFVPLFFISIGLGINLREISSSALLLLVVVVVIGVLGKWIGAGLGGLWGGLPRREAVQLGAGMISRGEVGLIVASVGAQNGFVSSSELSAVIGMIIVTTLITPPLLRRLFAGQPADKLARPSA